LSDCNENEFFRHISENYLNIKLHKNPSSKSRVVPCECTDRHGEAHSRFSQFYELAYKRLTWRTTADRLQVVLCIRCVTDMQLSICFFMQGTMHREKNNLVQHNGKYVYHLLQYATRVLTCLALFSQQTATIWTETAQSAQRLAKAASWNVLTIQQRATHHQ